MTKEIEVVDKYNARHRFPKDGCRWEWRLKAGSIDIEGGEFLDIFRECENGEYELIATFHIPAVVSIVTDVTYKSLPYRELQLEECPRCGFKPKKDKVVICK